MTLSIITLRFKFVLNSSIKSNDDFFKRNDVCMIIILIFNRTIAEYYVKISINEPFFTYYDMIIPIEV